MPGASPLHIAIIMDGNGRWAEARGLPRTDGHVAGARAVRRVVEAAPGLGIGCLTLFAFSSDNWKRPAREVGALMELFQRYLEREEHSCRANRVRVVVIGRRDRLGPELLRAIQRVEAATALGSRLLLRLAVDYSSRDSILAAAGRLAPASGRSREEFGGLLGGDALPIPDVDLLLRTGGERRLSDFLLWECAYAELAFVPTMWPDFQAEHLADVLADFRGRQRRFGALPNQGRALRP